MSNKNYIKVKINIKINIFVLLEPSNISYSLFKLKNRKIWKLQCQHLNFSLFIYSLSSSFLLLKKTNSNYLCERCLYFRVSKL